MSGLLNIDVAILVVVILILILVVFLFCMGRMGEEECGLRLCLRGWGACASLSELHIFLIRRRTFVQLDDFRRGTSF